MPKNILAITIGELEALISKMKRNDRRSGTVDLEVNVTLNDNSIIWEIDKKEGLR